jgi:hypothetical protein
VSGAAACITASFPYGVLFVYAGRYLGWPGSGFGSVIRRLA